MHQEALKTWLGAHFVRFGKVWPMLIKFDQSWLELTKFDQDHDQAKINIWLTIGKSTSRPSIWYFTGWKRTRNKEVMGRTVKIDLILSQIWLSIINKTGLFLGDIRAQSLLGPLWLMDSLYYLSNFYVVNGGNAIWEQLRNGIVSTTNMLRLAVVYMTLCPTNYWLAITM